MNTHLQTEPDDDTVAGRMPQPPRTPDLMLLDIVGHADAALDHPVVVTGPIGRRRILALVGSW